jgi:hypothetical protein
MRYPHKEIPDTMKNIFLTKRMVCLAPISTSLSTNIALSFALHGHSQGSLFYAGGLKDYGALMLEITVKSTDPCLFIGLHDIGESMWKREAEMIMPKGLYMMIPGKDEMRKYTHIDSSGKCHNLEIRTLGMEWMGHTND